MTAAEQLQSSDSRPRLLFVDDEQRVLNSIRIMFRRQFDLFLASHGAEALDIVKDKDIDVIVADHRMPKVTGGEGLPKAPTTAPATRSTSGEGGGGRRVEEGQAPSAGGAAAGRGVERGPHVEHRHHAGAAVS